MRRGGADRALGHKARIVERLPQTRMGVELCSVRQIDDAGGDVIDGGIVVIAGNRWRRVSEGRREAEQRASAKAARGGGWVSLPLRSNERLSGGGARRGAGRHGRRGWVRPSEEFLDDVAVVGLGGRGSDGHIGS